MSVSCISDAVCSQFQQVIWTHSESQYMDLLYLRSLYLTKRACLAFERSALTKMHAKDPGMSGTYVDGLFSSLNFSELLRQNAVEDYSAYVKIAFAVRRGVSMLACGLHVMCFKTRSQSTHVDWSTGMS